LLNVKREELLDFCVIESLSFFSLLEMKMRFQALLKNTLKYEGGVSDTLVFSIIERSVAEVGDSI